jgi:PAS domain S-box-containing protein
MSRDCVIDPAMPEDGGLGVGRGIASVGRMVPFEVGLLDAIAVPVLILDAEGHVIFWNRAHATLVGHASDELIGRDVREFLATASGARLIEAMASLSAGDATALLDLEWRTRAGAVERLAFQVRYGSLTAGAPPLVVATGAPMPVHRDSDPPARVAADISARAQNQSPMRASYEKYAEIASLAVDAIIAIDAEQRIVLFNQGAERIFGWRAEEAIGQPIDILVPVRSRERHRAQVDTFARGPVNAIRMAEGRRTIAGLRKAGDEFPAEADIYKVALEGSSLLAVVLRDISARKLRENRQIFLAHAGATLVSSLEYEETLTIVARLAVPILADCCIVDLLEEHGVRRLKVVHVDPDKTQLAAALEAVQIRESRSHPIWQVLDEQRSVLLPELPAGYLDQMAESPEHLRLLQELAPVSLISVPLVAHARVLGAISFFLVRPGGIYGEEDLRLAEELARRAALAMDNAQLYALSRRATRGRDEILGVVAHDLRNPLNTITLTAEVLVQKLGDEQQQLRSLVRSMLRASERANRLIQDLLDVARLEAGHLAVERAPCRPADLLDDSLEMMRPAAERASIELTGVSEPGLPQLEADCDRILQVFSNLAGNAIKFTPSGGRVHLGAARRGADVCFSVTDTGPGIAADALPHLFDRFWQARPADRRGAGLGLAIAKGIVEAHGGKIWVESTPGSGSTFFFTVPTPRSSASPS